MAFDPAPKTWIPDVNQTKYSASTNSITLPIGAGTFSGITPAEANAETGDIRGLAYGLIEGLYQRYSALSATGDAPVKMRISKSGSVDLEESYPQTTYTYVFQFVTRAATTSVSSENDA